MKAAKKTPMRRRAAAAREKSAAGGRSNAELRRKLAALERQLQNSDARLKQQQRKFAKLARTLEKRAAVDALTGLYNRQKFDELCAAEIARSRRYGTPLALIMYDIDRFWWATAYWSGFRSWSPGAYASPTALPDGAAKNS